MYILDSLLRFGSFNKSDIEVFRAIAFDRDKHTLTRSKALLQLGKFGNEYERQDLINRFNDEADYLIKRAIMVTTQQLSIAEKSEFYSTVKQSDQEQAQLIDYIKSLKDPIYFDDYAPSPISPVEEHY